MITSVKVNDKRMVVESDLGITTFQFSVVKHWYDSLIDMPDAEKRQNVRNRLIAQLRTALGEVEMAASYRELDIDPATGRVLLLMLVG
jgi:hypothetical protein